MHVCLLTHTQPPPQCCNKCGPQDKLQMDCRQQACQLDQDSRPQILLGRLLLKQTLVRGPGTRWTLLNHGHGYNCRTNMRAMPTAGTLQRSCPATHQSVHRRADLHAAHKEMSGKHNTQADSLRHHACLLMIGHHRNNHSATYQQGCRCSLARDSCWSALLKQTEPAPCPARQLCAGIESYCAPQTLPTLAARA